MAHVAQATATMAAWAIFHASLVKAFSAVGLVAANAAQQH